VSIPITRIRAVPRPVVRTSIVSPSTTLVTVAVSLTDLGCATDAVGCAGTVVVGTGWSVDVGVRVGLGGTTGAAIGGLLAAAVVATGEPAVSFSPAQPARRRSTRSPAGAAIRARRFIGFLPGEQSPVFRHRAARP
jgi:hypothetical protein